MSGSGMNDIFDISQVRLKEPSRIIAVSDNAAFCVQAEPDVTRCNVM